MSYTAYVFIKELKDLIEISDLQLIKVNDTVTDKIDTYKEFDNFYLFPNEYLCFVGSKESLSINSNEISFIKFNKHM